MITRASKVYHYSPSSFEKNDSVFVWEQITDSSFNELLITWNARRPEFGHYTISISILADRWSPWFPYAIWGCHEQSSFETKSPEHRLSIFQDTLNLHDGTTSMGFRIKVEASEGQLQKFEAIHVTATDLSYLQKLIVKPPAKSVFLKVPSLSQTSLPHKRAHHLCSPTSTTAVLRFLLQKPNLDPVQFATNVWDKGFDIFGNWAFNVAQAYTLLGTGWHCWVAHLTSFQEIIHSLSQKVPVVVSVKGPLLGSAKSYDEGHLIVISGYDANQHRVLCMDPAFDNEESAQMSYPLEEFIPAWKKRNYIAYIFKSIK